MASETINGDRMLTPAELERIRELIKDDIEMGLKIMSWVTYAYILEKEQQVSEGETPKPFSYHIVQRHCEEIERGITNADIPPGKLGKGMTLEDLRCSLEVSMSTTEDETRLSSSSEEALLDTTPVPSQDSNGSYCAQSKERPSSSIDTRVGGGS
jgi:hypothetical protein